MNTGDVGRKEILKRCSLLPAFYSLFIILRLQVIGDDHHVDDDGLEEAPLDVVHMVHFHHVADGVPAVVAGRNDHLGTGFADLLQLHVQALVTLRAELADAVEAAAATATEVVFAVALHFAEVFRDLAHDVAGVLGEAVVTDVVTRVLQGHGHLEALGGIDLDLALAQRIGQPFHIVQERDRRLAVPTTILGRRRSTAP